MSLFKSLDSIEEIESTPTGVQFTTIECSFDSFLKKIENGSMTDIQIQNNILYSYHMYIDYDHFKNSNTRNVVRSLWTNERFLKNLLEVLKTSFIINNLKKHSIITINKIAYDYYAADINGTIDKNSEVLDLLLKICDVINIKYIIQLSTIMDPKSALFLTMAHFSSFEQSESVNRLNEFIIKLGYEFSIKNIIYIYSKFYSEGFAFLFNHTMVSPVYDILSPLEKKNYDNISLALLYILESMPSSEIYIVLKQYGSYIMLMQKGSSARFSLRSLANDFSRILSVVEDLSSIGIYIP